jgi:L-asparaginase
LVFPPRNLETIACRLYYLLQYNSGNEFSRTKIMNKLLIVTTGGTIDKIYFDDMSDYQIGDPQIGQILDLMNVGFEFEVKAMLRKDSLHFTDEDRLAIHTEIAASDARHILITHGTDGMVKTAKMLGDIPGKTMVLTGALHPARFRDSDAVFNIGCAVGALQTLPNGAWIAMNGCIWDPRKVRKNRDENRFEALS